MADIEIQEKRGRGVWPWIIGVLVLAIVIWGVLELTGVTDATDVPPAAEELVPGEPGTGPATDPARPGDPTPQQRQ
jgi:hypothetical protein